MSSTTGKSRVNVGDYLSLQPAELTLRVAHFLDAKSLVLLSHTSRYLRCLAVEEALWKDLCLNAWAGKLHMPPRLHTLADYGHLRHRLSAAEVESILARRGVNCNDLEKAERAVKRYEEHAEKKRIKKEEAAAAAAASGENSRAGAAAAAAAARRRNGYSWYGYTRRGRYDDGDEESSSLPQDFKDYGYINYSGKDWNDDVDTTYADDDLDLSNEDDDDDAEEEEYGFTARHRHFLNRARLARRAALRQKAKECANNKCDEDGEPMNEDGAWKKPGLDKMDSGVDVTHEEAKAKGESRSAKLFDLLKKTAPVHEIVSVKWPSKWQQTYWTALEDGKRQMITYEELISLKWYWFWRYTTDNSWDNGPSRYSIVEFRRDRTRGCVNPTDRWPQDQTFRYRDNYIQVASFPEHEVRRRDDWGWAFCNPWVEYISIDEKLLKQREEDGKWYVAEDPRKKKKTVRVEQDEEVSEDASSASAPAVPPSVNVVPPGIMLPLLAFLPALNGSWMNQDD
ncbi:hypothetical protein BJ742DRAFT_801565 [Cladochytrium replicatum]|nr:hypothetical protein BJ742DRAFT_801565 [Cladochytrium replicatum]